MYVCMYVCKDEKNDTLTDQKEGKHPSLRTFARNFSNIDFFLKILPVKFDELVMSEM